MSELLQVWDAKLGEPADLDEALQLRHRLESLQPGPNPKFVSFARALQGEGAGRWWAQRMLVDAQDCIEALWRPNLAPDDAMPSLRAAIRHAVAHGLVAFVGYPQVVFLPGGRALPGPQLAMFKENFEYYDALLRPRTAACRVLVEGFRAHFAPLGFAESAIDPGSRLAAFSFTSGSLAEFARRTRDGWQRLLIGASEHEADSPHFECEVSAGVRSEAVEAIFEAVMGPGARLPDTFFFSPACFERDRAKGFLVADDASRHALPERVASLVMPVLDHARDAVGLNEVMNQPWRFPFTYPLHPQTPSTLADHVAAFSGRQNLKGLIAAWQVRSPEFDERVKALRELAKKRSVGSEAELDRMVAHLRAMP
jgi:hypothetical protein